MSDPYALHFLSDWCHAIGSGDLDEIMAMYEKDAVLLPTFGSEILRGQEQLRAYFADMVLRPNVNVTVLGEDVEINQNSTTGHRVLSGDYEFSWGTNATDMTHLHARYTFAVVQVEGKWLASTHHSSVRPA